MPAPDNHLAQEPDRYQDLLARESQITWERARVGDGAPSHLLDRTAWRDARQAGPLWWQPAIDPDLTWGRELAFVLHAARGRVLELGCGGGWLALALARRGLPVTGMDLCEPLLQAAQQYARDQGLSESQLSYHAADLNQASLPESTYDTILAWHSLHHLISLPGLMQQIRRALRPGGQFLICETVLDHAERSLSRALLSLPRKCAKLALLLLAKAGRVTGHAAAPVDHAPEACGIDSPFEGVGGPQLEAALLAEFRPAEVWRLGTWFWEGLPQYAFTTMSASRRQQRAALALLRCFRALDRALLRLGFRGNYLAGRFVPR